MNFNFEDEKTLEEVLKWVENELENREDIKLLDNISINDDDDDGKLLVGYSSTTSEGVMLSYLVYVEPIETLEHCDNSSEYLLQGTKVTYIEDEGNRWGRLCSPQLTFEKTLEINDGVFVTTNS